MLTFNDIIGTIYLHKGFLSNYVTYLLIGGGKALKSTGIVRKVDELGRVVIPIELRRTLGIDEKDALEIYVDNEKIILKKYEPACVFCGDAADVQHYRGKLVCRNCAVAMFENVKAI